MNPLSWLNPGSVLVDITPRRLRVAHHDAVREWDLARGANGEFARAGEIREELGAFLGRKPWQPQVPAWCALPATGVTLRALRLPRSGSSDLESVLRLQIEAGFPLAPDELAWGWRGIRASGDAQEVLLAAVKHEVVGAYRVLLEGAGLRPAFTLGALARARLAPEAEQAGSHLHFRSEQTEWLSCDAGGPQRLRVLPWGEQELLRQLVVRAGLAPDAASRALHDGRADADSPPTPSAVTEVLDAGAAILADWLPSDGPGPRVYLSGSLADSALFRAALARRWAGKVPCIRLESDAGSGSATTFAGLRRLAGAGGAEDIVELRHRPSSNDAAVLARPAPRRWAILAGVLLAAVLAMPYLEAWWLQPGLAAKLAEIRRRKPDLERIDRQSDFLRYLKQQQAPYLDVLAVLAKCTMPGMKVDGLNLNRKGELSLRVTLRQPQEGAAYRTKLSESGLFTSLVVEEQAPGPNRQGLALRLSGQVKPLAERAQLKILAPDPVPGAATNANTARAGTNASSGTNAPGRRPIPAGKTTNAQPAAAGTNTPTTTSTK